MSRALIIGSSGGIGKALKEELESTGCDVVGLSRTENGLDIADETSIISVTTGLKGTFDTILVATGSLSPRDQGPEKTYKVLDAETAALQFAVNSIGPMVILKHTAHLLPRDSKAVFAVLSARVGSIGDNHLGGWYSYRASKAALNQFIRTASIELARTHKRSICVALHPGTVATEFTRNYTTHTSVSSSVSSKNLLNVIDGLTPRETGQFLDWAGNPIPW
ncbi:SDR family NAD(P)-dependent oxidoreductase [Falsihalocynthiibacter arcticus]|uniref:C factor, cell signaling protein n=1 Tax=Falsihalocynthiibacter arcticus TaxID=1579316 RepID=A0A126V3W6_9RHOB|nr:SDR family NAD(P)-dependent oxidoreductase [Falsihalocynthiibacter arcticus]AML53012.1 C factor, cell signaling protein [Falsihalocynthiibacter arcticus]